MFDDPKEALRRMQEELLAAEETGEEGNILEETAPEEDEDIPIRPRKDTPTRAEGFGRSVYADEYFDEGAAVVPGQEAGRKKAKKQKRKKKKARKSRKSTLFLLLLALLAMIGWWLKWMN